MQPVTLTVLVAACLCGPVAGIIPGLLGGGGRGGPLGAVGGLTNMLPLQGLLGPLLSILLSVDTNNDRVLSKAELIVLFNNADTDDDEVLSMDEAMAIGITADVFMRADIGFLGDMPMMGNMSLTVAGDMNLSLMEFLRIFKDDEGGISISLDVLLNLGRLPIVGNLLGGRGGGLLGRTAKTSQGRMHRHSKPKRLDFQPELKVLLDIFSSL